jgi:hypothetical protein
VDKQTKKQALLWALENVNKDISIHRVRMSDNRAKAVISAAREGVATKVYEERAKYNEEQYEKLKTYRDALKEVLGVIEICK